MTRWFAVFAFATLLASPVVAEPTPAEAPVPGIKNWSATVSYQPNKRTRVRVVAPRGAKVVIDPLGRGMGKARSFAKAPVEMTTKAVSHRVTVITGGWRWAEVVQAKRRKLTTVTFARKLHGFDAKLGAALARLPGPSTGRAVGTGVGTGVGRGLARTQRGRGGEATSARLSQSPPSTSRGGLSAAQINKVIRSRRRAFKTCYERELQRHKGLSGKIVVRWRVTKQGRVRGAKVRLTTMRNSRVEDCIVRQVMRLRFPPAANKSVIDYPFVFSDK